MVPKEELENRGVDVRGTLNGLSIDVLGIKALEPEGLTNEVLKFWVMEGPMGLETKLKVTTRIIVA